VRPEIPGLGRVPVNVLAVVGFVILGFGHAGFWLLGAALEALWLWAALQNPSFRAKIDAQSEQNVLASTARERDALVVRLDSEGRARLESIEQKCARAIALQTDSGRSPLLIEANRDALRRLSEFALKLLAARSSLLALAATTTEAGLQSKIAALQADLADPDLPAGTRESKEATLEILQQRLANLARREESLEEVESDLARIEAQIDLAVEHTGLHGPDLQVTADLKFVSHFLGETLVAGTPRQTAASRRRVAE
jgi:ribose 1,5-bisphosphokinase PhnN